MPVCWVWWWVWSRQILTARGSGCGRWFEDCGRGGEAWGKGGQEKRPMTSGYAPCQCYRHGLTPCGWRSPFPAFLPHCCGCGRGGVAYAQSGVSGSWSGWTHAVCPD